MTREEKPPPIVLIIGRPGTGKTTLAKAICKHIPAVHLESDRFFWHSYPMRREHCTRDEFLVNFTNHLDDALKQPHPIFVDGHAQKLFPTLASRLSAVLHHRCSIARQIVRATRRDVLSPNRNFEHWLFLIRNGKEFQIREKSLIDESVNRRIPVFERSEKLMEYLSQLRNS